MNNRTIFVTLLCGVSIGLCLSCFAGAAEWGTLKGTFVYDGSAPAPVPATVTKDIEFCGKHKLMNETLVVNPTNKGIANVVLYIYLGRRDKRPPTHPDYAESANADVTLDNENCRFTPHVVLLRTTQTLLLGNKDPVGHNTKIDTFSPGNVAINPIVPAGAVQNAKFPAAERLPVTVSCNIHPWMTARLVVKDNPYMTVSDENGKFEIKNVPAGQWTFQAWQETSGYVQQVSLGGKKTSWKRGRFTQTIKPGENDLGVIEVDAANFKK